MYDPIVDHAIKNVWCTPDQDGQLILKPAKISPFDGVWNTAQVAFRNILLPVAATRFHVYQIGGIYPILLSLPESNSIWTSLASACNTANLVIDVYSDNGIQMPRSQIWYMVTPDRNVILAVQDQPTINVQLNTMPIYFRVYKNAYFASAMSDPVNDYIKVDGVTVNNTADILAIQTRFNASMTLPGATYAFVNGLKVSSIDLINVKAGDVVEYVYDSTVRTIIDLPFSALHTFTSTLDSKNKYLIHYPGLGISNIDYHDDIDFFIITPVANGKGSGVYYHRNMVDAVRMVTYKDYSIPAAYVAGYLSNVSTLGDISTAILRMHIRKSAYVRPLTFENNRVEELFKLTDDKIVAAMVGVNSTVPTWTADALESSGYTQLMRSQYRDITRVLVETAYGYNAVSKILADTPSATTMVANLPSVALPYGLINKSVCYEYDANGLLINWYQHNNATVYNAVNSNAAMVEAIAGIGGPVLDEVYGGNNIPLDPTAEYRFYTCPIRSGVPTNVWTDVTNTGSYLVQNNILQWAVDPNTTYTLVRSNKYILAYDLNIMVTNGVLILTLAHQQTRNGVTSTWDMQVPMGELDLFLNGYGLVEGIDYIFNFPEIVILNKAYLQNPLTNTQKVTVRFTGFCKSDLSRTIHEDKGFIKYGLLSRNNRYDIRDDKVLRIVVGGKLFDRKQLQFSESNTGVTVPLPNNGLPYSIRDIVVPLYGLGIGDTYAARDASAVIDKSVSDYMTTLLPEPVITAPNVITGVYQLYSPFCSRIIYDLHLNNINDPRLMQQYSDSDVKAICAPYEYLLKFDPTQIGLTIDPNYVAIHPHNLNTVIALTLYQYSFLQRVIAMYMNNNLVDISHFVSVV